MRDAIETLTLEDMDMYTTISRKIQKEDVFSLVDTYLCPMGWNAINIPYWERLFPCRRLANDVTGGKNLYFKNLL